jgi:hypothetical protein
VGFGMPPPGLVNAGGYLAPREGRSYLLFLTRAADGLHDPLSGHTFPTDSVLLLDKSPGMNQEGGDAAQQGDAADEALGGTVASTEVPLRARAGQVGRGHRFAGLTCRAADGGACNHERRRG